MTDSRINTQSLLIVGCGDLGLRAGKRLVAGDMTVVGSRRNPAALPEWMTPLAMDYTDRSSLAPIAEIAPDYLLLTQLPSDRSEAGYVRGFSEGMANVLDALGSHRPAFTVMVSSTRVYASADGNWVDEGSPLALDDPRAVAIIEAERQLMDSGLAAAVVRFGGIYGMAQGRLLSRIAAGDINGPAPVVYGNRIHREDAAAFLAYLFDEAAAGRPLPGYYTGVDSAPAPRHEVERWLAEQLGVEAREMPPPETAPAHKRCRNSAMLATGFTLAYPDYRAGYGEVLSRRSD